MEGENGGSGGRWKASLNPRSESYWQFIKSYAHPELSCAILRWAEIWKLGSVETQTLSYRDFSLKTRLLGFQKIIAGKVPQPRGAITTSTSMQGDRYL